MNIGTNGALGNIGQRIAAEPLSRGRQVTGFTRNPARIPQSKENITWKANDIGY
jgi:Putative NADH-flavin reductase